jgi:hypothetical protein
MAYLFLLLLFVAILGLAGGLVSPKHLTRVTKINRKLGRKHISLIFIPLIFVFFALTAITAPPQKIKTVKFEQTGSVKQQVSKPKPVVTTTKDESETQPIAFTTVDQDDDSLDKGQTEVSQAGQNGIKTLTYEITYENGQQISKSLISTTTTTQPIEQIVNIGTYVAPAETAPVASSTSPSSVNSSGSCYPIASTGNCYEPGEYCSDADHGMSGTAGDGKSIECEDNDGWRWEPV